ncbi:MAG: hypothetical protein SCH66_06840 [Methanolobus sp.]|nr:hypothetical protein [Methanolobus sp.]
MKTYNTSVIILLLAICIIAIALGYAGSKNIPTESATVVNVDASSAGMVIPQYLITSEVEDILLEISQEYPYSVMFADDEVTLVGYDAINRFEQSLDENEIDFDLDSVYSFYNLDNGAVLASTYIVYSPVCGSVTISYDELDKLLNGDNETISYYRGLLNNSPSVVVYADENTTVFTVEEWDDYNYSNEGNGVVVVTIDSTGE